MKKIARISALVLAAVILSSCTDISRTYVVDNTAASRSVTAGTEADDIPEDDEELEVIMPDDFTTTGTDPEPETSAVSTTGKTTTTFPKQTTPEEILTVNVETEPTQTTTSQVTSAAAPETTSAASETSVRPVTADAAPAAVNYNVIGENGILVSYQDGHYRGLMACFGTYGLCERWAGAVNTFAKKLPDAKVYSLTVPISSEFYTPKKFWDSGFTVSQLNKINHIAENLKGAVNVDAYNVLKDHISENIYSRTDHHWTPLGAYYAAGCFAEAAGVDFPKLKKYEKVSRSGYVGSMYTYSKDYHLYNDAETFTMYISPNADKIRTTYYNTSFGGGYSGDLFVTRNVSAFYCSFIGSDDRITKVETDVKNGRTLVVFKQSYGNALIPFLTSGFEKIYVCDMRYFDLNGVQFCKDVGATDVLCTDCVMIAAGNGGKYLEGILDR